MCRAGPGPARPSPAERPGGAKDMNMQARRGSRWLLLALLAGGWAAASPAAYVITPEGRVEGTAISADAKGEITLKLSVGERIFRPGEYVRAVANEPPEYNQAVRLIAEKKYAQALDLLNGIVLKYKWLDWDIQATLLIVEVDLQQQQPLDAVRACDKMINLYPRLKDDAALQAQYRRALIGARQFDRVEPLLNAAIAGGNRANAARAQLQRGDLRMAQNDAENAFYDYMRTVTFFSADKEIQPEALYKAAKALERMNDKAAARTLYQKLRSEYPRSSYAALAGKS